MVESALCLALGDVRWVPSGRWSLNGTTNVEAGQSRQGGREATVAAMEGDGRERRLAKGRGLETRASGCGPR